MRRILLIGACLLLPAVAFSAQAPAPREEVFKDGDVLEGSVNGPDFGVITTREPCRRGPSLLRVRSNFDEKVVRSVSEL